MDLPEEAKRAPSAPVWNQSFPSPSMFYVLCLSNEPGELSQWVCHDDSTINIVLDIIIIIIIIM